MSGTEVAWVAGVGAQAGLGAAVARRFAAAGYTVAVTGRTAVKVKAIADAIGSAGGQAVSLTGDVSSADEVQALAAKVFALGQLKVAVFNAGNAVRGTPLELTAQQFEATWRGSTFAGFVFARAALSGLLGAGGGSLIFTGASASLRGRGPFVAFAAAKAGLRSVAQSFAREYGPQGVHVAHVVIDGGINGEQLRGAAPHLMAGGGADGLLLPEAIAETFYQLHRQPRSAWTHELDLRPYKESF
jgi:NAD(P)-dependent dehydrogenase (short-subunit alcohol dehydrogenase family)